MMLIYIFHFGCPGSICIQDLKTTPPKAADLIGRFLLFCTDVSWASKMKNIDGGMHLMPVGV